jgi:hypothetical protein
VPIFRQRCRPIGNSTIKKIPKSLKTNTGIAGTLIANAQGMRLVHESDLLDQAERLLTELKAIEEWNTTYWRNRDPDVYETTAFITRKRRRSEIIRQMVLVRRSLLHMAAGEGRVCPYCEGKGCVLVEVFIPDGPVSTTAWVSQDCPLCEGTGRLYGSTEPADSSAVDDS